MGKKQEPSSEHEQNRDDDSLERSHIEGLVGQWLHLDLINGE